MLQTEAAVHLTKFVVATFVLKKIQHVAMMRTEGALLGPHVALVILVVAPVKFVVMVVVVTSAVMMAAAEEKKLENARYFTVII